jgi:hypothetical protein
MYTSYTLRRISGAKRDEVTGDWRRLHEEKLYALCFSPDITRVITLRRIKLAKHAARIGVRRGAFMVLVGKRERKPLGRPRSRW